MSLSQMVKFLIFLLDREGIDLCFRERARWHALLYHLKFSLAPEMPSVLRDVFFEWEGLSPVCRELDVYLDGFHRTRCLERSSSGFSGYRLSEGVSAIWLREYGNLTGAEKYFLERIALKKAREEFTRIVV